MVQKQGLKISAEKRAELELAALDTLRAIAQSPDASPSTRAQAAKALLEAIRPRVVAPRERTRPPAPSRTPEELRAALVAVRKQRIPPG